MKRLAVILCLAAGSMSDAADVLAAQSRYDPRGENRMLRRATTQEARGELTAAEATLRELLRLYPASSAGVFALERILRNGDRLDEVLPVVDDFLMAEPGTATVWALKLSVLAETGAERGVDETVREWIGAVPGSPDPYQEGALAYLDLHGAGRAAALIEEGLDVLGDLPVLLLELGDVHVAAGRVDDAAGAWARALGRDRARNGDVFRRVADLEVGRDEAVAVIVTAVRAGPATVARLEAGAELALREGREDAAREFTAAAHERLDGREARGFLNGFARKAEDLDRPASALWAYRLLHAMAEDAADARATDERMATAALAAGDTAAAIEAQRRITRSFGAGTSARRTAWTEQLGMEIAANRTEAAMEGLAAFRQEFPDANELDALSATLASRLLGSGMRAEALEVLEGIDGPGASLERAFLLLEGGAVPEGIVALQASIPDLEPVRATEVLELSLALSELTPVGAALAAQVAISGHRGRPADGLEAVAAGIDAVPPSDRPAILAMAAHAADGFDRGDLAMDFRRRLVAEHSDAREFPDAAVRLARAIAVEPGGRDEAVRILEALIVSRPDSPVVPGARRELRRIQNGGSS